MPNKRKFACPSCKRSFKTAAALAQHRSAAHSGSAQATRSARNTVPRSVSVNAPNVIAGTDLIVASYINAGSGAGRFLQFVRISPRLFDETRLHQVSTLWGRWKPRRLAFKLQANGASTTYGALSVGWTPDATLEMSGTDITNYNRVLSLKPSRVCRLNQSVSCSVPCDSSRKWYLCNGTPDDSCHGAIILVCAAQTGGYTGAVSYTMTLDWEIAFEGIDMAIEATDEEIIGPDAGWTPLFTTSDGSFNSAILTFKHHHGGDMVPFSAARKGHVYTTAPGTKVQAYDSSKALFEPKYFVAVQKYSTPGLLMCQNWDDARDYIRTGNLEKVCKYYTQGPEVTPMYNPRFKMVTQESKVASDRVVDLERQVQELTARLAAIDPVQSLVFDVRNRNAQLSTKASLEMFHDSFVARPSGTVVRPINVVPLGFDETHHPSAPSLETVDEQPESTRTTRGDLSRSSSRRSTSRSRSRSATLIRRIFRKTKRD